MRLDAKASGHLVVGRARAVGPAGSVRPTLGAKSAPKMGHPGRWWCVGKKQVLRFAQDDKS
jgi:hypothetical protein